MVEGPLLHMAVDPMRMYLTAPGQYATFFTMIFRQLFEKESSTYTYLLADEHSGDGVIIDPVWETLDRDKQVIDELGVNLKLILDTHVHADHITSAASLKQHYGARYGVSEVARVPLADINIKHGQTLQIGQLNIQCLSTPGHTNTCMSYVVDDRVFTGDALLIRGCGRTDFQQGNAEKLFDSVRQLLFSLPDETFVYPAHDYKGRTVSTIGEEKRWNERLKLENSLSQFKSIMDGLNLANPKKIDEAVPANEQGGK